MLPSYFDHIFVHLRQKVRLRPKLSPKFLSTLGPNRNPTQKAGPDLQLSSESSLLGNSFELFFTEFPAFLNRNHQAQMLIVVKGLIQGGSNVARVQVETKSRDQGRHKNDALILSATLPTILNNLRL